MQKYRICLDLVIQWVKLVQPVLQQLKCSIISFLLAFLKTSRKRRFRVNPREAVLTPWGTTWQRPDNSGGETSHWNNQTPKNSLRSDNKWSRIQEPDDIENILCKTTANVSHFLFFKLLHYYHTELNSKISKAWGQGMETKRKAQAKMARLFTVVQTWTEEKSS